MTDITIPPSVLEAAARAYAVANDTPELWWRLYEEKSRAALLAGLKAWPGSYSLTENDSAVIRDVAAIIPPLTENTND